MAILEIRNVAAGYGEVQILWGTELSLEEGQLTSLVGANGAGKTTMLREVARVLADDANKRVIIVDDVISTGSTLRGMEMIVEKSNATVSRIAAVFTEGDNDWTRITALGNLPVFRD